MALVLKDRVKETTITTGTGTYTLAGAVTGFEAFSEIGDGNTTYYACTDGTDFEVGIGTYTASGTTLARTTILQSSNSDAAVNWTSGTRDIFCTQPAEKAVFLDAAGNIIAANGSVAMLKAGGTFTGDVTLLSTDSGSGDDPSLILKRDSSSPADFDDIGNIDFVAENSASQEHTYASISGFLDDVTDGTEDGRLRLSVSGGGSMKEAVDIVAGAVQLVNEQSIQWTNYNGIYHTILNVATPTGSSKIITLPDATGTVAVEDTGGLTLNNGVIALKNGGAQSEVRLYCESGNAHYSSIKAATHADLTGVGNVTSTLPNATGTLLGTNNADDPATTTSASDAEHVLINDGGVLKKIDPSDLGIGSGGGGYADSNVDTHLNTSTASANEVLSWNGSDYDWVAQSGGGGGGGGATNLTGLSDVNISSVQNNDLLMYNSTASEWQNTNLGLTIDPSISSITSAGSTTIGTGGTVTVVVVPSSGSYQNPAYFAEVRNSTNTSTVITNANISRSGGTLTFTAPAIGSYVFRVKVQDFGDLQSEFVTQSFTVVAPTGPRYVRLSGSGGNTHTMVMDLTFYTGTGQTGTVYPDHIGHMTSDTTPSPLVASSSGHYGSAYQPYEAFDANTTSTTGSWWNLALSSTYANWYLQLDLGSQISLQIQSASIKFFSSYGWHGGAQTLTLETSTDGTNFTTQATFSKPNSGGVFNIG